MACRQQGVLAAQCPDRAASSERSVASRQTACPAGLAWGSGSQEGHGENDAASPPGQPVNRRARTQEEEAPTRPLQRHVRMALAQMLVRASWQRQQPRRCVPQCAVHSDCMLECCERPQSLRPMPASLPAPLTRHPARPLHLPACLPITHTCLLPAPPLLAASQPPPQPSPPPPLRPCRARRCCLPSCGPSWAILTKQRPTRPTVPAASGPWSSPSGRCPCRTVRPLALCTPGAAGSIAAAAVRC
jgi:hypothetical protein